MEKQSLVIAVGTKKSFHYLNLKDIKKKQLGFVEKIYHSDFFRKFALGQNI